MKANLPGGARSTLTSLSVMARQFAETGTWSDKLLPTPSAHQYEGDPDVIEARRERERAKGRNGNGFGLTTAGAVTLLPTPAASGGGIARNRTTQRSNPDSQHHDGVTLADVAWEGDWGPFAKAIKRWEAVTGEPSPPPTIGDTKRLNPVFVRWMMGYPRGWCEGIARRPTLTFLGNAVVPQCALAALSELLGRPVPKTGDAGALLPTPRASDANGSSRHGDGGKDLRTTLASDVLEPPDSGRNRDLLPTPTARDWRGRDAPTRTGGRSLVETIEHPKGDT